MKIKDQAPLYQTLLNAKNRYDGLRSIFDEFKDKATNGLACPNPTISGIQFSTGENGALHVSIAQCTVRFRFVYDRLAGKGIVVIDDITGASDEPADLREIAAELWRFTFDGQGNTSLDARDSGDEYNLNSDLDCMEIVLGGLDSVLDKKR